MLISGVANAGKGLIFLLLPVLCSCGHMPVASMIQLSRVEFTQTTFRGFARRSGCRKGWSCSLGTRSCACRLRSAAENRRLGTSRSPRFDPISTPSRRQVSARATREFACSLSVRATCRARRHFELSCWHGSRRAVNRGAMSRFQFCRMAAGSATGRMVRCASQLTCKPRKRAASSSSRKISTCELLPAPTH